MWNDQWTVLSVSPSIICHSLLHPVSSSSSSSPLTSDLYVSCPPAPERTSRCLPVRSWTASSSSPSRSSTATSHWWWTLLLSAGEAFHPLTSPSSTSCWSQGANDSFSLGGCAGSRPSCSSPAPAGSCGGWFASEGSRWALVRIFVPFCFRRLSL